MTETIQKQETPRLMSVAEIIKLCKCSQAKVSLYFSNHQIQPAAYRHEQFHNVKLYEVTDELEKYFKTAHKTGPIPTKEKNMVTLPKPTQPTPPPTPTPTPPKGMTMREMADYCGCSLTKVAVYVRTCQIKPSGVRNSRYHHNINEYDFTPTDEAFFRTEHKIKADKTAQSEAQRIASGWLTIYEVAAAWNCSCYKAFNILTESNAPIRWEYGNPYNGRKFYKMPEHTSRDPSKVHYNNVKEDDWLDSVRSKEVRDMVLDERKWRGMVGKRVAVELKKYDQRIEGVLKQYSMCWFIIKRDNGRVETYKHNEAKVLKEAE